jgi:hypothetical protein
VPGARDGNQNALAEEFARYFNFEVLTPFPLILPPLCRFGRWLPEFSILGASVNAWEQPEAMAQRQRASQPASRQPPLPTGPPKRPENRPRLKGTAATSDSPLWQPVNRSQTWRCAVYL